jgi:hypothetical protein
MCWINVPQYTILVPNAEELAIFTLNKAGIRVFPVKTEYVTDAPLMKLMMRYTSYSHAHHPKMTVILWIQK